MTSPCVQALGMMRGWGHAGPPPGWWLGWRDRVNASLRQARRRMAR